MALQFLKEADFIKLDQDGQVKEILVVYGATLARLNVIEHWFVNFLRVNRLQFEGAAVGKTVMDVEILKFEEHYANKATLGMMIKDLREKYDTASIDTLLEELLNARNVLVHKYWKENFTHLPSVEFRMEVYVDLLEGFKIIERFDDSVRGTSFASKKNPAFLMRFNPK